MRLPSNGRYGLPLIRPSTFRAFFFDTADPFSPQRCLIDGYALAWSTSPGSISSPSGAGKLGVYEGPASITSYEQYAVLGDSTMHMIVRVDSGLPNLFWYNNDIADVYVDSNRAIGFYSNNTYDEVNSQSGAFEYGEWFVCTLRKRDTVRGADGLPTSGGTSTVEIMVNGQLVAQKTNFATGTVSGLPALQIGNSSGLAVDGFFYYAEPLSDDQIAEDIRRIHQLDKHCRAGLKVTVDDVAGEPIDMTNLLDIDWVSKVDVTDDIDSPTMNATVSLLRSHGGVSIASLVEDAEANLSNRLNPTSYVSPLLEVGRGVEIYSCRTPLWIRPKASDWMSMFKGNIDEVKDSSESIDLSCRDLGNRLIDAYIEREFQYSDNASPIAVEEEMQAILDDNDNAVNGFYARPAKSGSYGPVSLYTPTTPNWEVAGWIQRREPVLSALRTLAGQIGWDVRYRFDQLTNQWRLTFFQPDRLSPRATNVFTDDDIIDVTNLSRNILGIRNAVRVIYPSSETTEPFIPAGWLAPYPGVFATSNWFNIDGEGNRLTAYVDLYDANSSARVGRRLFMEVAEAGSSQIDTIAEAFDFAIGMLQDLAEEDLSKSIAIPLMPELELNDLPKVMPIKNLFTSPQRLAIKRLSHSFSEGAHTTTIEMRGKPSVGQRRWLRLDTRAGGAKPPVIDPTLANADNTTSTLLGPIRNFLDRTGYFAGGRFLQVRNQNFQSWTNGVDLPPDGWSLTDGSWGVDAVRTTGSVNSGSHAVALYTYGPNRLLSDFIPILGRAHQPFSVDAVCSFQSVTCQILFYDQNKQPLLSGDTPYPSKIEKNAGIALSTYYGGQEGFTTRSSQVLYVSRSANVATYKILNTAINRFQVGRYVTIRSLKPESAPIAFEVIKGKVLSSSFPSAGINQITVANTGPDIAEFNASMLCYAWARDVGNREHLPDIEPPADASFARIGLVIDGNNEEPPAIIDSVSMQYCPRQTKVQTCYGSAIVGEYTYLGDGSTSGGLTNGQPYLVVNCKKEFDTGHNWLWASTNNATYDRYPYFLARRTGQYLINATVPVYTAQPGTMTVFASLLKSPGTVSAASSIGGILQLSPSTGATVLATGPTSSNGLAALYGDAGYTAATLSAVVSLTQNDRIALAVTATHPGSSSHEFKFVEFPSASKYFNTGYLTISEILGD